MHAESESPEESQSIHHDIVPKSRTPLPKLQLFIVFLIQFTEPLTGNVIYPFVNQFVRDTGITGGDERRTGYYAGIIGSVFFFAEAVTVFHWGWLSDRVGRKPILLFGSFGLMFAMLSFGLSSKFWSLVVSRCAQGIFNGNIGVSKTVIAELTDSTNIADAFSMVMVSWSLGSTIGPIFGGLLSKPAKRWPALFGRTEFFRDYPYFLPCAATGLVALAAGVIGAIKLKETLPSLREKQNQKYNSRDTSSNTTPLLSGDIESYGTDSPARYGQREGRPTTQQQNEPPQRPIEKAPPIQSLLIPQVLIPVLVFAYQAFIDMSGQVLLPLMYSTSIPVGGLGMDSYRIGVILSVFGCCNAVAQLMVLPRLIRRTGPKKVNALAQMGYVCMIGLYPLLKLFARREGRVDAKVWAVIVLQLVCRLTTGMGYGSIQIVVVDSAPSTAALSAINGMAQALGCVAKSMAPSIASSLFSLSLQQNLAKGNLVYVVLGGCALFSFYFSFYLPSKLRS